MVLNPQRIPEREKLILSGLFLSKFDATGLQILGFESFIEAFNVIGYGLGARPASIKNYRDEFDPLFPNQRKGWHKRPMRQYCAEVLGQYNDLSITSFADLVRSFVGLADMPDYAPINAEVTLGESSFAKRLITGIAAEHYFQSVQPNIIEFNAYTIEDTTKFGCGYDFRLWPQEHGDFIAVEVKGLAERSGLVSLTDKEHQSATILSDRFFLFVVKNFQDKPFHEIHRNPLASKLQFARTERQVVRVSWQASA